jgi:hypothetical protein
MLCSAINTTHDHPPARVRRECQGRSLARSASVELTLPPTTRVLLPCVNSVPSVYRGAVPPSRIAEDQRSAVPPSRSEKGRGGLCGELIPRFRTAALPEAPNAHGFSTKIDRAHPKTERNGNWRRHEMARSCAQVLSMRAGPIQSGCRGCRSARASRRPG